MPAPPNRPASSPAGLAYGVLAYASWGVAPIFWKALARVPATELLAHRMVWALFTLGGLLLLRGRLAELRQALRTRRIRRTLVLSGLLLATNWLVFIYATLTDQRCRRRWLDGWISRASRYAARAESGSRKASR